MTDWIGIAIAALALTLSGYTWFTQNQRQKLVDRQADVTVAFHWLPVRAHVKIAGQGEFDAGYHLVLINRGPAQARAVNVDLTDYLGQTLRLLDLAPDELPLIALDASGKYPIPWIIQPFTQHSRRFNASVSWVDNAGQHVRTIPLRRGQIPG